MYCGGEINKIWQLDVGGEGKGRAEDDSEAERNVGEMVAPSREIGTLGRRGCEG